MDEFQALYAVAREIWRGWFPDPLARGGANAVLFMCVFFLFVLAVETFHGTRTRNYRSRQFGYDLAYYFYYRIGLHRLLVTGTVVGALVVPLSFLDLGLLRQLPMPAQVVIGMVLSDFMMYWLHRAQHRFKFLWAFHTTHHAPEQLTFASFLRFHPVEVLVGDVLSFVILSVLGTDFTGWVMIYLITAFFGEIQHSQIPWKFGPLRWIIVSPSFHAYHHSPDRATHDRNFGGFFAFWDYLFGTAVPAGVPPPKVFGLHDVKADSLLGTLWQPFVLLWRSYRPTRASQANPADLEVTLPAPIEQVDPAAQ